MVGDAISTPFEVDFVMVNSVRWAVVIASSRSATVTAARVSPASVLSAGASAEGLGERSLQPARSMIAIAADAQVIRGR